MVGQDRMDRVGNGCDQGDKEAQAITRLAFSTSCTKANSARPINRYKQVELTFGGLNLGDVNVDEADRIGFEPLLRLLVALDLRCGLMPYRCRQRCKDERVRCGIVALRA